MRFTGALIALVVSGPGLGAQEGIAAPSTDSAVLTDLVGDVAVAWSVDPTIIAVDVRGGIPEGVDSLHAQPSSPETWVATLYMDGRAIRRFVDVGHRAEVDVAALAMPRGTVLDAESIEIGWRVLPGPPSGPRASVVGMVAERALDQGEILESPAVRPPVVVRGGDQVEAVLRQRGVTITVPGQALGSARAGEEVRVRLASGVRRRATATGDGFVTLIPGGG